ncbi:MAG: hypothetical protein GXC94_01720 [Comamonadaceae bacterium]|nr:hypothetical protein [Comamonadaceae bacterium]
MLNIFDAAELTEILPSTIQRCHGLRSLQPARYVLKLFGTIQQVSSED